MLSSVNLFKKKFFKLFFFFFASFFLSQGTLVDFYDVIFYKNDNHILYIIYISGFLLALPLLLLTNSRLAKNSLLLIFFMSFLPIVYIYTKTNNLIIFFICYELLLLPSFFIIILFSPNRRSLIAANYFLIWTQFGSMLVLVSLLFLIKSNNTLYFTQVVINKYYSLIFFVGFGIKVPIWPFHYWLSKTHTEAPTFFSIYLSGFLVKTSLYGIWVLVLSNNFSNLTLYLIISTIGIFDSSLKMWGQTDLKKLIAFATIQEMNLILSLLILSDYITLKLTFFFIIAHSVLSSIFFYITDLLYKRYNTRSVLAINGLLNTNPLLGFSIFISVILFGGLPFTLKFIVEIFLFSQLINVNLIFTSFIMLISNWIAIVSFSRHWFFILFGSSTSLTPDLSRKELVVLVYLLLLLVSLPYFTQYIF